MQELWTETGIKIMSFFKGITAMINRTIYGIPPGELEAGTVQFQRPLLQPEIESPMFKRESELTQEQIHGVGEDGSTWQDWRTDDTGLWYRRTSNAVRGIEPAVEIAAFDADSELGDFDFQADDDTTGVDDILGKFRRDVAILKARHGRGELSDVGFDHTPEYGSEGSDDDL